LYKKEEIDWSKIKFENNSAILKLISGNAGDFEFKDDKSWEYMPIFGVINDKCLMKSYKDIDISQDINNFKHPNIKTNIKIKDSY